MERNHSNSSELKEKLIKYSRVTKVTKGGSNSRWAALVVVGNENGRVGIGSGKAIEVPESFRKAVEDAKKHMINVPRVGTTIPHRIIGEFGSGKVILMPAPEGTGIIAGGVVRAVLELAGIRDVRAKSIGTNNARNVLNATMAGLAQLKDAEEIARRRGKNVSDILG